MRITRNVLFLATLMMVLIGPTSMRLRATDWSFPNCTSVAYGAYDDWSNSAEIIIGGCGSFDGQYNGYPELYNDCFAACYSTGNYYPHYGPGNMDNSYPWFREHQTDEDMDLWEVDYAECWCSFY